MRLTRRLLASLAKACNPIKGSTVGGSRLHQVRLTIPQALASIAKASDPIKGSTVGGCLQHVRLTSPPGASIAGEKHAPTQSLSTTVSGTSMPIATTRTGTTSMPNRNGR